MTSLQANVFKWLDFGSPVWTRFELLRPVDPLIEPADVYCFRRDSSAPRTPVQGGHPVWTRLELAKGEANTATTKLMLMEAPLTNSAAFLIAPPPS